ncbi:MAG: hypothetical protein JF609_08700 [Verrucomicrobia bacterium]|nr:hypothetical protein [Verrucomicrobiota bacterium]
MSIHQSKGLEFPIVVLADLAKSFNERDLHGEIIFDEEFGLCPKVKPPSSGRRYPSLPHWLAGRRQKRELRGEEIRLLYVALTRARDNLILTMSLARKKWDEAWTQPQAVTVQQIAGARSFADWLALWFRNQNQSQDASNNFRWRLVDDEELKQNGETVENRAEAGMIALDKNAVETLRTRLAWNYPFTAATTRKAKSSVTALRREAEELDDEAETLFPVKPFVPPPQRHKAKNGKQKLSAAETGAAHHKFLQHVGLDKTSDLAAEAARLMRENYLSADEHAALDLEALAEFWPPRLVWMANLSSYKVWPT